MQRHAPPTCETTSPTAVLLGAAIGAADAALWPRHLRWLLPIAGIVAGSFIAIGRHFIWSMTGA